MSGNSPKPGATPLRDFVDLGQGAAEVFLSGPQVDGDLAEPAEQRFELAPLRGGRAVIHVHDFAALGQAHPEAFAPQDKAQSGAVPLAVDAIRAGAGCGLISPSAS